METIFLLPHYAVMPTYFFHLEGDRLVVGQTEEELPDDDAARHEAELVSRDLARNRANGRVWHVVVTNESGDKIAAIPTILSGPLARTKYATGDTDDE
jgi:hypothetical protein